MNKGFGANLEDLIQLKKNLTWKKWPEEKPEPDELVHIWALIDGYEIWRYGFSSKDSNGINILILKGIPSQGEIIIWEAERCFWLPIDAVPRPETKGDLFPDQGTIITIKNDGDCFYSEVLDK